MNAKDILRITDKDEFLAKALDMGIAVFKSIPVLKTVEKCIEIVTNSANRKEAAEATFAAGFAAGMVALREIIEDNNSNEPQLDHSNIKIIEIEGGNNSNIPPELRDILTKTTENGSKQTDKKQSQKGSILNKLKERMGFK